MKTADKFNNLGAFTIIELLVAMASFIIIISIITGGLPQALRSQRQAAALMNMNDNISLVLEQMAREIRTGYNFCAGILNNGVCNPNPNTLSFINTYGQNVQYKLNKLSLANSWIQRNNQNITADNVVVEYLSFVLLGEKPNDNKQPRITILIGVRSKESGISGTVINLQTTVSPRVLDS